jgi:hypothetical protein
MLGDFWDTNRQSLPFLEYSETYAALKIGLISVASVFLWGQLIGVNSLRFQSGCVPPQQCL